MDIQRRSDLEVFRLVVLFFFERHAWEVSLDGLDGELLSFQHHWEWVSAAVLLNDLLYFDLSSISNLQCHQRGRSLECRI